VFGEDTEIDKHLAEEMVDSLLHLVRNAIDHGIEDPVTRKKAGKDPIGTVRLKASQRGKNVVIEVSDDGGGIDIERVREKAIEKGMITDSGHIDDRDLLDFMFMPGFSTKDTVTETSGRGVGLDVVKDTLTEIGGFVEINTGLGKGTTFILTLPITLAIVKALIVRAGSEVFAVPISSIHETFTLSEDEIQYVESGEVYNLRGELLPLVRLSVLLGIESAQPEHSFAIATGHGDKRMAILVDELANQHEIVIKPMSDYFDGLPVFAGAAEISSNEIVLVLDVEGLISSIIESKRFSRAK
jgi:two-component system chemotaxis sensor kinase CheA